MATEQRSKMIRRARAVLLIAAIGRGCRYVLGLALAPVLILGAPTAIAGVMALEGADRAHTASAVVVDEQGIEESATATCRELDLRERHYPTLSLQDGLLHKLYTACQPFQLRASALARAAKVQMKSSRPQAVAVRAGASTRWTSVELARDGDRHEAYIPFGDAVQGFELMFQEPWAVRELSVTLLREDDDASRERAAAPRVRERPASFFLRPQGDGWHLVRLEDGSLFDEAKVGANLSAYRAWFEPSPDGSQLALFDRQGDLGYAEPYRLQVFLADGGTSVYATDHQGLVLGEASWTGPRHLALEYSCGTRCVRRDRFLTERLPEIATEEAATGNFTGTVKLPDEAPVDVTWHTAMTPNGNSAVWYNFDTLNMDLQRARVRAAPTGELGELELVFNYVPEAFGDPVGSEGFAFAQVINAEGERLVATDAELELTAVHVGTSGERTFEGRLRAAFTPRPWSGLASGASAARGSAPPRIELDVRFRFSADVAEPGSDARW